PNMLREMRTWRESATEKSLRAFSHRHEYQAKGSADEIKNALKQFLTARDFRFKMVRHDNGDELIVGKAGTYQRFGYFFRHGGIVIICLGGWMDGNMQFKGQELV